ncbi:hypothetical protein [Endozoicomonas sp. ONNA1]|uniref:hypothetical protein n=1 Tax=Endozoicomonas sp. ONNA1 TaxID=2828740 RepID=UPI0021486A03|nr:hypothetical protein [Endozoicomonas sp. ONNA1]
MPDFSELKTYEEAIDRLFEGRGQDFKKITTEGGQIDQAYTALFDGMRWFVKIVREDCSECDQIRFEYEWLLKKNLPRYRWLAKVNAELVLPDRAATFMLNRRQHYIVSYPLVTGQSIGTLYRHYLHSAYLLSTGQKTLLSRIFYRYGQVLALSHLDPKQPAKNSAEMLGRVVRLHLPDRNGRNEIYDLESDRIYLVDLADSAEDFGRPIKVGEDLEAWSASLAEMIMTARTREGVDCGPVYDCIVNPFKQFALGYASSLPLYKRTMVMDVVRSTMMGALREECDNEMEEEIFCPAVEMIEQQFFND